jgi:hypothetical protein
METFVDKLLNYIGLGKYASKERQNILKSEYTYFIIDRIIDANCNNKSLIVGVYHNSKQGMRLRDENVNEKANIKQLISSSKIDNRLEYVFEDNYKLTFTKDASKNKLIYCLETPNESVTKEMADVILKYYKKIDLCSAELDLIADLIYEEQTKNELQ